MTQKPRLTIADLTQLLSSYEIFHAKGNLFHFWVFATSFN